MAGTKRVREAEAIMTAFLEAGYARTSTIAEKMPGQSAANYKAIPAVYVGKIPSSPAGPYPL